MLYSSGTTGFPKGVKPALPHRRIDEAADPIVAIAEKRWGVTAADVYLSPAPIYHAEPLRWCGAVQVLGETVLLAGQFDAEATLKYVEQYHVRVTQMVPTMFVRLLKLDEATRTRYDLSSLRMVVHAAAPCPGRHQDRDDRLAGPDRRRVLQLDRSAWHDLHHG
jgi:acyl-coenzyme A synthetase/AMP-(fatty) acid ligase